MCVSSPPILGSSDAAFLKVVALVEAGLPDRGVTGLEGGPRARMPASAGLNRSANLLDAAVDFGSAFVSGAGAFSGQVLDLSGASIDFSAAALGLSSEMLGLRGAKDSLVVCLASNC